MLHINVSTQLLFLSSLHHVGVGNECVGWQMRSQYYQHKNLLFVPPKKVIDLLRFRIQPLCVLGGREGEGMSICCWYGVFKYIMCCLDCWVRSQNSRRKKRPKSRYSSFKTFAHCCPPFSLFFFLIFSCGRTGSHQGLSNRRVSRIGKKHTPALIIAKQPVVELGIVQIRRRSNSADGTDSHATFRKKSNWF